jgi:hypothetical protein
MSGPDQTEIGAGKHVARSLACSCLPYGTGVFGLGLMVHIAVYRLVYLNQVQTRLLLQSGRVIIL